MNLVLISDILFFKRQMKLLVRQCNLITSFSLNQLSKKGTRHMFIIWFYTSVMSEVAILLMNGFHTMLMPKERLAIHQICLLNGPFALQPMRGHG